MAVDLNKNLIHSGDLEQPRMGRSNSPERPTFGEKLPWFKDTVNKCTKAIEANKLGMQNIADQNLITGNGKLYDRISLVTEVATTLASNEIFKEKISKNDNVKQTVTYLCDILQAKMTRMNIMGETFENVLKNKKDPILDKFANKTFVDEMVKTLNEEGINVTSANLCILLIQALCCRVIEINK